MKPTTNPYQSPSPVTDEPPAVPLLTDRHPFVVGDRSLYCRKELDLGHVCSQYGNEPVVTSNQFVIHCLPGNARIWSPIVFRLLGVSMMLLSFVGKTPAMGVFVFCMASMALVSLVCPKVKVQLGLSHRGRIKGWRTFGRFVPIAIGLAVCMAGLQSWKAFFFSQLPIWARPIDTGAFFQGFCILFIPISRFPRANIHGKKIADDVFVIEGLEPELLAHLNDLSNAEERNDE